MECKKRSKGRGRGVLALTSYEPCPRPSVATVGSWHQPKQAPGIGKRMNKNVSETNSVVPPTKKSVNDISNGNTNMKDYRENNGHVENFGNKDIRDTKASEHNKTNGHNPLHPVNTKKEVPKININAAEGGMIAKYSYKANPERPGGFDEITIKQGEKLILIHKGHKETKNPLWWEVENERGEQGFVPGTYCMIIEKAPTALPWLENKRLLEDKEEKKREAELATKGGITFGAPAGPTQIKEYRSAYTDNNNTPQPRNAAEASKQYYCEICDKSLNGPQPYKMHMSSRAHREEVEYQQSK